MQNLLRHASAFSIVVILAGLVLGLLGLALPMLGVESRALGYFMLAVAVLLILMGVVLLSLKAWYWRKDLVAERNRLRTALERLKPGSIERTGAEPAPQEAEIDLGDTAPVPLFPGKYAPVDDTERRPIFFPALVKQEAHPPFVSAGRTFTMRGVKFEDCDIFGPVVFVLAEGPFAETFLKCEWEEEWEAFWPHSKRGRYVGATGLENCAFKRCTFTGVAVVLKRDEYERQYRRFTGDLNGP